MWRRLVVLSAVACAGPPPAPRPAAGPAPVAVRLPDVSYAPPTAAALPPSHVECHAFSPDVAPSARTKTRVYDFAPMILAPLNKGPRIAERPRVGFGRTSRDLRAVFSRDAGDIKDCWKYQSSRGAAPTTLTVSMAIEPLGTTRDLTVIGERAEDQPLAVCVGNALAGAAFPDPETRPLRLTARLAFTHAKQAAWNRAWPVPSARPARDLRTGTVCTHVIDDGQIAQVDLATPIEVTDWDDSREPPRRGVPEIRIGCARSTPLDTNKRAIRIAVTSNYGALQSCYAVAAARDPHLAGNVTMQLTFDQAATPTSVKTTGGVGDPPLHACMVAAIKELWVAPAPRDSLEVNLTFTLAPAPVPPPAADDPSALLAAGDAEAALAAWAAKLRTPVPPELACRGRAGVLLAIAALAPWLDDARFHAAIAELARAAAVLTPPRARACVAPVADTIGAFTNARGAPAGAWALTHISLERYAAALPLAPYLDDGPSLRWHHAAALLDTARRADAIATLDQLARDKAIGPAVTADIAERKREPTVPISDTCGD